MQIIGKFFSALIILLSVLPVVAELTYPERPIRIIVNSRPAASQILPRELSRRSSLSTGRPGHNREHSRFRWRGWRR